MQSFSIESLLNLLARYGFFLAIVVVNVVIVTMAFRAQRKVRVALSAFASTLGWGDLRKSSFRSLAVRGTWNGRAVGLGWQAAQKSTPAYVSAQIALDRPGRFEIRSRPAKESFLRRPIMLFGPPKIEFFDPADAARYHAWASDRPLVDSFLAISGIRERLDANLADGGVLSLKKGRLRIRRPFLSPRPSGFKLSFKVKVAPDLDRVRSIVAEEWGLLAMVAG